MCVELLTQLSPTKSTLAFIGFNGCLAAPSCDGERDDFRGRLLIAQQHGPKKIDRACQETALQDKARRARMAAASTISRSWKKGLHGWPGQLVN